MSRYWTLGGVRSWNAHPVNDETYSHESEGSWNVSMIQRDIAKGMYAHSLVTSPMHPNIIEVNAMAAVNEEYAMAMPKPYCELPLIGVQYSKASMQVITVDGNHRLRRWIKEGRKEFSIRIIPFDMQGQYHMWMEVRGRDGIWRRIDEAALVTDPEYANTFDHQDPVKMAEAREKWKNVR